jgi:DNA-binding NarL/FixJ family response regulator
LIVGYASAVKIEGNFNFNPFSIKIYIAVNSGTGSPFILTLFFEAQTMSQRRGLMVKGKNKPVKLPPRQLEILGYLKQNLSYKEMSDKMGIKVTTVDDHIDKLYKKLGTSNARDAVLKARKMGLIQ